MAEDARAHNGDAANEEPKTPESMAPADETVEVPEQAREAVEAEPAAAGPPSAAAEDGALEGVSLDPSGEVETEEVEEAAEEQVVLEELQEETSAESLMEELAAQRAAAKAQADAERKAAQEFAAESPVSEEEAAEAAAAASLKESLTAPDERASSGHPGRDMLLDVPEEVLERAAKAASSRKAKKATADALAAAEAAEEDIDEAPAEPLIRPVPDDGIRRRWYAIHAHSGQEGTVKRMLEAKAELEGLREQMTNVFVPMEEVAEIRSGEKKVSKRKFFPGYVLVQLPEHPERHADLWHLIRETTGVTGFIGSRTVPVPLEDDEVNAIIEEIRGERERPKPKVNFEKEERVKIIDGPFANFVGTIDEINSERGTLKVLVEIFERLTSVEVEFWQVEHI